MSDIETGGPAFPTAADNGHSANQDGMTLMDYFAAHAPQPPSDWRGGDQKLSDIIEWRWWYANQMLRARKQAGGRG